MPHKISAAWLDELVPGKLFIYKGARRWWGKRSFALGQLVGVQIDAGVVFVSTLFEDEQLGDQLQVEVGFLPIVLSEFKRSLVQFLARKPLSEDSEQRILEWKNEHLHDNVGAFNVPIFEVERMAWETIIASNAQATKQTHFIASVLPKADREGRFTITEVHCVPRSDDTAPSTTPDPVGRPQ